MKITCRRWLKQLARVAAALLFFAAPSPPSRAQAEQCVAAPSGLIGWWRGEDNAVDAVSKAPATLDTASYVAGKVGRAFNFANTATTVRFAASARRNEQVQNGFTLELWVKPLDAATGEPLIEFRDKQDGVGVHLWIYDQTGRIWGNVRDTMGGDHGIASGAGLLRAGVWQHIALVYDRAGFAGIYLDGALVARQDLGSFAPQMSYDLVLAGHRPGDGEDKFYRGALDEVSLYDHPLAREEIAAIYRAGAAGKCVTGATPASTRVPSVAPWSGRVSRVLSGDMMMVRRANQDVRVELYGVAAPRARGQNFAAAAMQWLKKSAVGKIVTVYPVGKSEKEPLTAWVFVGNDSLNAGIVRDGLSWWDNRRAPRETKLKTLMQQARAARRGLWKQKNPVAPWVSAMKK